MRSRRFKASGGMRRPCNTCEEYFLPSTKGTRICDKCRSKSYYERLEKNKKLREKRKKEQEKNNAA